MGHGIAVTSIGNSRFIVSPEASTQKGRTDRKSQRRDRAISAIDMIKEAQGSAERNCE